MGNYIAVVVFNIGYYYFLSRIAVYPLGRISVADLAEAMILIISLTSCMVLFLICIYGILSKIYKLKLSYSLFPVSFS